MADTTIPVIPAAQDLEINLAEAEKTETQPSTWNLPPDTNLNLDLDLNLPEAPKNDDRLKTEDKKNQENLQKSSDNNLLESPVEEVLQPTPEIKVEEIPVPTIEPIPELVVETPVEKEVTEQSEGIPEPVKAEPPEGQGGTVAVETPVVEEVLQPTPEIKVEEIPVPVMEPIPELVAEVKQPEAKKEEVVEQVEQPSKIVEEEAIPATAPAELKKDMKMISELEWNKGAGGLAPEAIVAPQSAPAETPKTFDLDSMLGGPTGSPLVKGENERGFEVTAPITSQPVEQKTEIPEMPPIITATPMKTPPFTIPTTTSEIPVSAIPQTNISSSSTIIWNNLLKSSVHKNASVKALLFVVMFIALGFTTFFILKTMYPVEFGNIFGGGQTNMHASEAITETELTGIELTGTELTWITEELTGTTDTGTTINNGFWELNDLWNTTEESAQTDLSRLTDYVNQGNDFLAQGKAIGNNTVIKYGLYISKKATNFLEKIANGEEINNLSGYFAQFDQYIEQLKVLVGETPNPDTQ